MVSYLELFEFEINLKSQEIENFLKKISTPFEISDENIIDRLRKASGQFMNDLITKLQNFS